MTQNDANLFIHLISLLSKKVSFEILTYDICQENMSMLTQIEARCIDMISKIQ